MKKIHFVLIAILTLLVIGCTKDSIVPTNKQGELEFRIKEFVTKPMTMWIEAIADPAQGVISCVPFGDFPAGGWMQGHATHMGQFDMPGSPWAHGSCYLVFDANGTFVKGVIEGSHGQWTAANGDILFWQGVYEVFPDGTFSADMDFTGGTGRFENASGNVFGVGQTDPETGFAVGTAEGYINMQK